MDYSGYHAAVNVELRALRFLVQYSFSHKNLSCPIKQAKLAEQSASQGILLMEEIFTA